MTIYNLGSINIDHFYEVPNLPAAGETIAAGRYRTGLGGKGANQSVAIARAGARVSHIGMIGPRDTWIIARLQALGVDTSHIGHADGPGGHAIINIDAAGENTIVIFPGANRQQNPQTLNAALAGARSGDWLILQNETSLQEEAAELARAGGLRVAYSAAPFDAEATRAVLPYLDLLIVNAVEAAQLSEALNLPIAEIPVPDIVVTKGADGADWINRNSGKTVSIPAFSVTIQDTTGAGDTFAGYLFAGLSEGLLPEVAMRLAAGAAALKVMRPGTAEAIPERAEVEAFLAAQ